MNIARQRLCQCGLRQGLARSRLYSQARPERKYTASRVAPLALGAGVVTGLSFYFFYPDASRSAPTSTTALLSPSHFTPSTVLSNENSGPDTKLLELVVPPELLPRCDATDPLAPSFAPIWSVYIKDDDIQVERPYTPLEGVDDQGRMLFWIKKYPKGEVGRWLHLKKPGEKIELRGPLTNWLWKESEWDEIVMISGGTGITPFYQLLHSVISRQSEASPRFTLLHSSRTPAELPPPKIMDTLSTFAAQNPQKFRMELFVDSREGTPPPAHLPNPRLGRIGKPAIEQCLGINNRDSWWRRLFWKREAQKPSRKVLFLVCGPDQMVNAISGPFGRNFSQGPIGGILSEMGFSANEVWKL
ncbi:hypothetical protein D9615_000510 [Tricholomella constricta]|uniref:FAD-binding FR-type domain-containing protein n=1 Tax=Tricholomella constricta TaxID=117010 RepID=A0A8H5HRL4_9AGAR|nr:hypothetical protein D9615_000510 [Tricholomella constricta]